MVIVLFANVVNLSGAIFGQQWGKEKISLVPKRGLGSHEFRLYGNMLILLVYSVSACPS